MPHINMTRIWPPPRYPLIHKAKKIFQERGEEGFKKWTETLDPGERVDLVSQIITLLSEATGESPEAIARALIKKGL